MRGKFELVIATGTKQPKCWSNEKREKREEKVVRRKPGWIFIAKRDVESIEGKTLP